MILQALAGYYERKAAVAHGELAPPGFEWKDIPLIVVLRKDGHFLDLEDTREGEGKQRRAKRFLVPQSEKRPGSKAHEKAFLLWDGTPYIFGIAKGEGDQKKAPIRRQAFLDRITATPAISEDEGVAAVLAFLKAGDFEAVFRHPNWPKENPEAMNVSFRLESDTCIVPARPIVANAVASLASQPGGSKGICLVTGAAASPARLHPPIKGVKGAQSTRANIVSFNLDAFCSYGKEQGGNAPIGEAAAFAYTTALNHLLERGSRQCLQVGDATTVFWAEKECILEDLLADIFGEPSKDDPDRNTNAVRALLKSPEIGTLSSEEGATRFFVLGLSPNASRLSVRFWHVGTVKEMAAAIRSHFLDLEIVRGAKDVHFLPLWRLLVSLAPLGKLDQIPPNLAGDFFHSILAGAPYPSVVLQSVLRRVRAEKGAVTYPRAALIKAYLNRENRLRPALGKEVSVSLDQTNSNIGYRLGRLFSVLEKIQEEANPNINATIRDRYYGAASSTPAMVFPILMRLKNHHLAKLENRGRAVNLERLISEIMDGIADFPSHMRLDDQGRFAIGYYHQRQAFFTKTSTTEKGE